MNQNYHVRENLSEREFDQTDFGRIYFNLPSQTFVPKSVDELAAVLRDHNARAIPVRVRNTGHSVNGQTLTSGVQIQLRGLQTLVVDEVAMSVRTGVGNSWDAVLKALSFPKYCLPIFPNNPHQEIHIGGTASVGGCGFYSSSRGGFWNHVRSLVLVTMTGEVIRCSRTENQLLFRYALGGYGRVGVIAELEIAIEKSTEHVLIYTFLYRSFDRYFAAHKQALTTSYCTGILCGIQVNLPAAVKVFQVHPHTLTLFIESDDLALLAQYAVKLKDLLEPDMVLYAQDGVTGSDMKHSLDFTLEYAVAHKKNLVYWHPNTTAKHVNELEMHHPWSDYVVPMDGFTALAEFAHELIQQSGLASYLTKEAAFHNHIDVDAFGAYTMHNPSFADGFTFPLSLDLPGESMCFLLGLFLTVPAERVADAHKLVDAITDRCYELGGKRYLYGLHTLTREQVIQQYGEETIAEWNKIKLRLDPQGLLNRGVIPFIDEELFSSILH